MVYKCMWDNIVTSGIPFNDFFEHFRLRPQHLLSEDIRVHAAEVFPDAKVLFAVTSGSVIFFLMFHNCPLWCCLLFPFISDFLLIIWCRSKICKMLLGCTPKSVLRFQSLTACFSWGACVLSFCYLTTNSSRNWCSILVGQRRFSELVYFGLMYKSGCAKFCP